MAEGKGRGKFSPRGMARECVGRAACAAPIDVVGATEAVLAASTCAVILTGRVLASVLAIVCTRKGFCNLQYCVCVCVCVCVSASSD